MDKHNQKIQHITLCQRVLGLFSLLPLLFLVHQLFQTGNRDFSKFYILDLETRNEKQPATSLEIYGYCFFISNQSFLKLNRDQE